MSRPGTDGVTDERELKDKLFIRGVCPHCDSVEFYIKDTGDLECKKCKYKYQDRINIIIRRYESVEVTCVNNKIEAAMITT